MLNISKKKIWSVFAVVHHCFLLTYKRHGHLRAVIFCIFQMVTVGTFLNTEWSSTSVLDRQLWNCVFRILFTNYNYLLCILLEMFNYIITIQLLYPHKQLFLFFLLANNFLETVLSSFKIHCCNLSLIKEDLEWFRPLHLEGFPIGVIEILSGLIFFFGLLPFFFSSPFWMQINLSLVFLYSRTPYPVTAKTVASSFWPGFWYFLQRSGTCYSSLLLCYYCSLSNTLCFVVTTCFGFQA